ncbi:MAG: RNA 2',3'-cyclic phosphodiesterase [Candidatus Micrarchaeota archaeon]|nr:RNA 2',3'-cyclic phosphodiesterase [Candidatus Micrarchaeota archaeon]
MQRLFIAIDIPEELKAKISILQKALPEEGMKLVEGNALHITLKFLGNINDDKIEEIKSRLKSIQFDRFEISVKSIGVFPNEKYVRVIWIGCEGEKLAILNKQVEDALAGMFEREEFASHVTLAKVREKIEILPFLDKHKHDGIGKFQCDSFYLYRSDVKPKGPVYTPTKKFKCRE